MHFKKKTYRGSADEITVPEDKSHMVLPEIEEEYEDEDGQKLSLTSLLLESSNIVANIGLGDLPVLPMQSLSQTSLTASREGGLSEGGYCSSPALSARHRPGAWRNPAETYSMTDVNQSQQ